MSLIKKELKKEEIEEEAGEGLEDKEEVSPLDGKTGRIEEDPGVGDPAAGAGRFRTVERLTTTVVVLQEIPRSEYQTSSEGSRTMLGLRKGRAC